MTLSQAERDRCAQRLLAGAPRVRQMTAFIGLDGFVDDILHVVDKRESADKYSRMCRMEQWAARIHAAAGKSTNLELVSQVTKLGGNGPIMANALASLGLKVTYLGLLGYPNLHPVFADFARRAEVFSIAEPGYTDAVEFEDGKVMLGKHQSLRQMNWENLKSRFGLDQFTARFAAADLVGFVNWTMLTHMSDIWEAVLTEVCPRLPPKRRKLFLDLADPEKRTAEDLRRALALVARFESCCDVTLGLNQKESGEVGKALGLDISDQSPEGLCRLGQAIRQRVPVQTVVIHPVPYALAVSNGAVALTPGPTTDKPLITTGAGDHFNSGFSLGKLLGLEDRDCLLAGVTCSGFYVRTARSPSPVELAGLLQDPSVAY